MGNHKIYRLCCITYKSVFDTPNKKMCIRDRMYTAMAVFAFAFFVLLFVQIPEPNANASTEPIGQLMKGALKFRHFVLGAIAIFVYVGIEVGVPGTLNPVSYTHLDVYKRQGLIGVQSCM